MIDAAPCRGSGSALQTVSAASRSPSVIRSTAEFARYVGLSRSAVSRVLNGQPGLRKETIERVEKAIADTGFTPNAHARQLRGGPSTFVGVCMENFLTPTGVLKLSSLQNQLASHGYTALTETSRAGSYQKVVQHLLSLRVAAIVFIGNFDPVELAPRLDEIRRAGIPHLVVDHPGVTRVSAVTVDRVDAMKQVTNHLLGLGHKRIGLLGLSGPFQSVEDRIKGINEALVARKFVPAKVLVSHDERFKRNDHFEYGRTLAQSFADAGNVPTAFIAVNDETAVGALLEFQARGFKVPEQISIIGFNNQNICLMTRPALSTVDQQIDRTIGAAVDTLLRQITRGTPTTRPVTDYIEPQLVLRGSTGPAPK